MLCQDRQDYVLFFGPSFAPRRQPATKLHPTNVLLDYRDPKRSKQLLAKRRKSPTNTDKGRNRTKQASKHTIAAATAAAACPSYTQHEQHCHFDINTRHGAFRRPTTRNRHFFRRKNTRSRRSPPRELLGPSTKPKTTSNGLLLFRNLTEFYVHRSLHISYIFRKCNLHHPSPSVFFVGYRGLRVHSVSLPSPFRLGHHQRLREATYEEGTKASRSLPHAQKSYEYAYNPEARFGLSRPKYHRTSTPNKCHYFFTIHR